jgi:hypothetical protein
MPIWFRFYNEAIDDRKLKHIARTTGQSKATILGVWAILLSLANNSARRGTLAVDDVTPFTREDLLAEIGEGMSRKEAEVIFAQFLDRGLVAIDEDGNTHFVTQFNRRNFVSDDSKSRVRRHRKQKDDEEQAKCNGDVTAMSRRRNAQNQSQNQNQNQNQNSKSESQQQTTQRGVDADAGYDLLADFGIDKEGAAKYAAKPLANIQAHIADARAKGPKLHNPQGFVIDRLKKDIPPPRPPPSSLCPDCHIRPCRCEEFATKDAKDWLERHGKQAAEEFEEVPP